MKRNDVLEMREGAGAERLRAPSRRRLGVLCAGALAVLLVLVVVWSTRGSDAGGDGGAAGTATSTPTTRPEPVLGGTEPAPPRAADPGEEPVAADELPPSLAAVAFEESAATGDGVTATVPLVEDVDGVGQGRGNVSGPAVRVTVRLTNGTAAPVDLDGVAIRMTYGSTAVPAPRLDDPSEDPFRGSLVPGGSADGRYVFSVPAGSRRLVTVSVGYRAGAPFMVFTGSAP